MGSSGNSLSVYFNGFSASIAFIKAIKSDVVAIKKILLRMVHI